MSYEICAITPIFKWRHNPDHRMAPCGRSLTWLRQDENKIVCPVGTTTDHKSGAWMGRGGRNVLEFLIQNEGKSITVIDGHTASDLCGDEGFREFGR
jgi:uncharacterized membrane protein